MEYSNELKSNGDGGILRFATEQNEEDLSDEGDLSDNEIESTFCSPYHLVVDGSVSSSKVFALHMSGTTGTNPKVAVSLSDTSFVIYDIEKLRKITSRRAHRAAISSIKFSPQNDQLLYSASKDGLIKLWDIRTEKQCVSEFKDETEGSNKLKPITSFDISFTERHLCAGTELIGGDAFLLFWDVRTTSLLGGYWESHTDDITQVYFHPTSRNKIASSSMDGLINIFDISEKSEDDALQQCLNTEASVEKLGWFSHGGDDSSLSCITHTEHLQLWDSDGAAPYHQISREQLTQTLHRKSSGNSYLVDVHPMKNPEDLLVVAGSSAGQGECLRISQIRGTTIKPMSQLIGNKQIVRTSWYNKSSEVLVTAGEGGIISVWKPNLTSSNTPIQEVKMRSS